MYYVSGDIKTNRIKVNTGDGKGGRLLSPEHSIKVTEYSKGFAWGDNDSGASQLALAILLTCTTQEDAERLYQTFREEHVAKFPKKNFSRKIVIRRWLTQHGAKYIKSDNDFMPYTQNGEDSVGRACGDQCTKAITTDCNCSCGGSKHGIEAVNKKQTTPEPQPKAE